MFKGFSKKISLVRKKV